MAETAEIQTVSHRHDMIMNWLIANPEKKLRDCAEYFNLSQSWLSIVIHSDVFQAKFRERQEAVFGAVAASIPEKLKGLADLVSTQLADALEKNHDKEFTLDAFDKIMHRAGYAPQSQKVVAQNTLNVQQNNFIANKELLEMARGMMRGQIVDAVTAKENTPIPEIEIAESEGEANKSVWEILSIPEPQIAAEVEEEPDGTDEQRSA